MVLLYLKFLIKVKFVFSKFQDGRHERCIRIKLYYFSIKCHIIVLIQRIQVNLNISTQKHPFLSRNHSMGNKQ